MAREIVVADAVLPPEETQMSPGGRHLQSIAVQLQAEIEIFRKLEHEAAFRAVRIGLLLLRAQDTLKRGEFEPWLENNIQDFSRSYAYRFMKLAGTFLAQKQIEPKKAFLVCEALPDRDQPRTGKAGRLVQQVFDFIQGKSLNDLFDEYGIKKRAKPTGGANMLTAWLRRTYPSRPGLVGRKINDLPPDVIEAWEKFLRERDSAGLPAGMTPQHFAANTWWTHMLGEIHSELQQRRQFLHLNLEELKAISASLMDARRVIDDQISRG